MEENKKPDPPTPEQLLKLLDAQMVASRQRRESQGTNRTAVRIFLLGFIVVGAALALWVLMYMLEEMRPNREAAPQPMVENSY